MSSPTERSLYHRAGGYEAVAAVITELHESMLKHPQIGSYWRGHSNDSKVAKLKLFVDFVCEATGGPVMYQGRDMKTTHEGLNISEADWKDFVKLTASALNQSGLPVREKDELFSFLTSFKSEMSIAEPPAAPTAKDARNANGLTPREMEVLQLVALGRNNSQIAQQLSISLNTVTRHLSNIFIKTSTTNRVEAAMYAARHGLA